MPTIQKFKQKVMVLDTYDGIGKTSAKPFHSVTVLLNGREMSFFSEVSLSQYLNKEINIECYLKPDFKGNPSVQVSSISEK
jgi:hypothetical protein